MSDATETERPPPPPRWWRLLDTIAVLTILPSLLAGTARWWWIGDLCCHFRLPYAVSLSVLAMAYVSLRRWRWLSGVCVILAVNAGLLWPLFAQRVVPRDVGEPLRVMAVNVYIGNHQTQSLVDLIRRQQPDIILLVEVDDRWMDELHVLEEAYPYQFQVTRDAGFLNFGPFGMAVLSKLPLDGAKALRLGTAQLPVITAQINHDSRTWTIFGAHPYPPVTAGCAAARDSLLSDLAGIVDPVRGPKIVCGDLNITRWSPHFAKLLAIAQLRDSEAGFGYQPTWPDWLRWPVLPIDHVLTSPDVAVIDRRVGPSIDSDHRPLIVDVAHTEQGGAMKAAVE